MDGISNDQDDGPSPGADEEELHAIFRSAFRERKDLSGPGDDCAVLSPPAGVQVVLSCDQVIGGVHLLPERPPAVYARKLLRRSLSDLAAAGAAAWAVSWTVAAPAAQGGAWLHALVGAFLDEAEIFGVAVIGGDLAVTSAPGVVLSCTVLGLARSPVPGRGGARPGDVILVSGRLGGAVPLDDAGRPLAGGRHEHPQPRLELGAALAAGFAPHAMMDLSDGLGSDLPRLLARSGSGARIDLEDVPLSSGLEADPGGWSQALYDGEDYELLVVLDPDHAARALASADLPAPALSRIGEVVAPVGLTWCANGQRLTLPPRPWTHHWEATP